MSPCATALRAVCGANPREKVAAEPPDEGAVCRGRPVQPCRASPARPLFGKTNPDFPSGPVALAHRYLVRPGADQILAVTNLQERDAAEVPLTAWALADRHGSVHELLAVDSAGTAHPLATIRYDALGVASVTAAPGSPRADDLPVTWTGGGFHGAQVHAATGLVELDGRWYDAAHGRYVDAGPIHAAPGRQNPYEFHVEQPLYAGPGFWEQATAAAGAAWRWGAAVPEAIVGWTESAARQWETWGAESGSWPLAFVMGGQAQWLRTGGGLVASISNPVWAVGTTVAGVYEQGLSRSTGWTHLTEAWENQNAEGQPIGDLLDRLTHTAPAWGTLSAVTGGAAGLIRGAAAVSVPRTTAGRNLLELAPESQGFHRLTARFENIPDSMWADFPAGVPRPTGPINLIEGAAYDTARAAANKINGTLSRGFKLGRAKYDVHEIVPVKFGGSPTDLANKVGLPRTVHREVSAWFGRLQRLLEGGN